jgi:hypothetical protein
MESKIIINNYYHTRIEHIIAVYDIKYESINERCLHKADVVLKKKNTELNTMTSIVTIVAYFLTGFAGSPMHPHQQYGTGNPSTRGALQQQQIQPPPQPQQQQQTDSSVNATDLGFDFLDNLQTGDASNFNPQELLNSLDSGFNLDSIL